MSDAPSTCSLGPIESSAPASTPRMRSVLLRDLRNCVSTITIIALLLVVCTVTAFARQQLNDHRRLVGVWHASRIDCEETSRTPDGCEGRVQSAELVLRRDGRYRWLYHEDFEQAQHCEGRYDIKDELVNFNSNSDSDCDFDLEDFAPFTYQFDRANLILRGTDGDATLHLARGPLHFPNAGTEPPPCVCNQDVAALEKRLLGRKAHEILSDHDLEIDVDPRYQSRSDAQRRSLTRARNEWLDRAVRAFAGRGAPVLLEMRASSVEGDPFNDYLDVRTGHAEVIHRKGPGLMESLEICTCTITAMHLADRMQDHVWRFVSTGTTTTLTRIIYRCADERGQFPH